MRLLAGLSYYSVCALLITLSIWPWVRLEENAEVPRNEVSPLSGPNFSIEIAASPPFQDVLTRPIFSPSRRNAPPKVSTPTPTATPPIIRPTFEGYRLTGMVEIGSRKKILLETPDGKTAELFQGESIDGWRLERVSGASVILQKEQWTVDLLNPDLPNSSSETQTGSSGRNTTWLPKEGQ